MTGADQARHVSRSEEALAVPVHILLSRQMERGPFMDRHALLSTPYVL